MTPKARVVARTRSHRGVKVTTRRPIERIPMLMPVRLGMRHS